MKATRVSGMTETVTHLKTLFPVDLPMDLMLLFLMSKK